MTVCGGVTRLWLLYLLWSVLKAWITRGSDLDWKGEGCQLLETIFLQFNRNANWLRFFFEPEVCLCGHQMPCNRSLWFLQPRVKQQWREIQLKVFAHLFPGSKKRIGGRRGEWGQEMKIWWRRICGGHLNLFYPSLPSLRRRIRRTEAGEKILKIDLIYGERLQISDTNRKLAKAFLLFFGGCRAMVIA